MEDKKTLKVKCFITGEESIFSGDYLNKTNLTICNN